MAAHHLSNFAAESRPIGGANTTLSTTSHIVESLIPNEDTMTPEEYKHIEIEKFIESTQEDPLPGCVRGADGNAVHISNMTTKSVRLVSYEDVRKRFFHDMNQTDETDCENYQYSH